MTENREAALLERLRDAWDSGELPKAAARHLIAKQAGTRPCDAWTLGNYLLMIVQGTEDARGYKQWQQAGRQVRKGARAIHILAPKTVKRQIENASGETEDRVFVAGFFGLPVFRMEDTEGAEIIEPDYRPGTPPRLAGVAAAWGIDVAYVPHVGQDWAGVFNGSTIRLASHDETTFFHELAHAAHSRIRPGGLKGGQHADQEVVAETTAAALALYFGLEPAHLATCQAYVKHYDHTGRELMRMTTEVESSLRLILETAESLPEEVMPAA